MRTVLAGLLIAATVSGASAETVTYTVPLIGSNEVPPNDSRGTGTGRVTFDTATRRVTWHVEYRDLTGPVIGMHFHGPSEPGKNAGIVLPFTGKLDSPVDGAATLTESQAANFSAGGWYLNIHTGRHPGGELRGQVVR